MRVSNVGCVGTGGWVCLDPNGQHMTKEESARVFAFVLAYHLAGKKVRLEIDQAITTSACGGSFPLLYDVRTAS